MAVGDSKDGGGALASGLSSVFLDGQQLTVPKARSKVELARRIELQLFIVIHPTRLHEG